MTQHTPLPVVEELPLPLPTPGLARHIRLAAGLTQGDLARSLDVSARSVMRWESGAIAPSDLHRVGYISALYRLANGGRL